MNLFNKTLRYIFMYGLLRTLSKVFYQIEHPISYLILRVIYRPLSANDKRVGIIGLGNHGFTLIAFFACVAAKSRIKFVVDPSKKSRILAEKVLGCKHYKNIEDAQKDNEFFGDIVYIASDHLSHTKHALLAADSFDNVYVEKPLFVNDEQKLEFQEIYKKNCNVYTGFNRPHSPMFKEMSDNLSEMYSITMVINGHFLPSDHWYRVEGQGSRVLGNLTHWLDLSVRVFLQNSDNCDLNIELSKGHLDDLVVTLSSCDKKVTLVFSANCEPTDGVEEFIFWNSTNSIGKILNFREISYVTKDRRKSRVKKFSKDVGHKMAVLAPIYNSVSDFKIPYISSVLALRIEEMYNNQIATSSFKLEIE